MTEDARIKTLRLKGLMRKEFLQIKRDPSSLAIAFVLPLFLLLLFGYGVSLDAKHVPVGWVIDYHTAATADFRAAFEHSEYFDNTDFRHMAAAEQALQNRQISAIIRLQSNFGRDMGNSSPAQIQLILDGVDANNARLLSGYVQGAWTSWLNGKTGGRGTPVVLEPRIWYNNALLSKDFLVPGLIAIIMTLIGALLTAMVMSREWERGTLEAMIATPITMSEVLLGKIIPYYILGMGGMLLAIGMAVFLFDVPLRGSFWVLLAAGTLFLFAALGMGLLISIAAKNQFVAGQVAILVTFLPAFILSGFIFNIDSMPEVIRFFTYLITARYFVSILKTVFLAGDLWSVILPEAAALIVMAAIFLTLAGLLAPKRLE